MRLAFGLCCLNPLNRKLTKKRFFPIQESKYLFGWSSQLRMGLVTQFDPHSLGKNFLNWKKSCCTFSARSKKRESESAQKGNWRNTRKHLFSENKDSVSQVFFCLRKKAKEHKPQHWQCKQTTTQNWTSPWTRETRKTTLKDKANTPGDTWHAGGNACTSIREVVPFLLSVHAGKTWQTKSY